MESFVRRKNVLFLVMIEEIVNRIEQKVRSSNEMRLQASISVVWLWKSWRI